MAKPSRKRAPALAVTSRATSRAQSSPAAVDAALLQAVLTRTPGVLWVADIALRCQFASSAATARLGITPGQGLEDVLAALAPPSHSAVTPLAAHRHALGGASARCDVERGRVSYHCLIEPLVDAAGRVIGVLGTADDDTLPQRTGLTLRAQQQLLETTLQQATDGIAIADAKGRLVFFNPPAARIAVANPEGSSLANAPAVWGELFDEQERLLSIEEWPIARALRGETIVGRELSLRQQDGTRTYIQIAAAPVRDGDGTLIGAVTTFTDISDRKRAEAQMQALNESLELRVRARTASLVAAQQALEYEVRERRQAAEALERQRRILQAILNRSTAVIHLKDSGGRFLQVSRHFERLFGVSNDQILGKTDYDVFPVDIAARLRANDERVIATGESLQFEEVVPQEDGPHTYVSVKFPLRDDDGTVYATCSISTDITDRQAIEAELRRSEATLSAVIESTTDAVFSIDREYRLVMCNAVVNQIVTALFGRPPRIGTNLREKISIELAARWYALVDRALAGERFMIEEALPIGGVQRHFLVSLNPTLLGDRVNSVTVFAKDITELRRAEEQARLHQADLAHVLRVHTMGEMAANLAHEINQPLGAIANYAQGCRRRLQAGAVTNAELLRTVEEIAREALRAGEITRRARELLRKDDPRRSAAAINEIVAAALETLAPSARQRAISIEFRQQPALPPVEVDSIQIEQVVLNLVLNALDAVEISPGTREIKVRTTAAGAHAVEVAVCDNGVGLDAAQVERVFEPFLTTKPDGLGMGLAISRSIIETHGGQLWATSNPEGGCTFRFVLPAAKPPHG